MTLILSTGVSTGTLKSKTTGASWVGSEVIFPVQTKVLKARLTFAFEANLRERP